jgi:hypothetical protein
MALRGLAGFAALTTVCGVSLGWGCGGQTLESADGGPRSGSHPTGSTTGATSTGAPGSTASSGPRPTLATAKKLDLLFDIDNSSSMADKQAYLAQAIPDLVRRLVTPNCVDGAGAVVGASDVNGSCTQGVVEFPPVHDMHIGVVTSSLGPRLGNQCNADATQETPQGSIPRHNDDQGHLINRSSDPNNLSNYIETPLDDLGTANFLNWFPSVAANAGAAPSGGAPAIGDPAQLQRDFQSLVVGAHAFGCGVESQLESWYRFLIQPDPYQSLKMASCGHNQCAQWVGVDTTILEQRAAFLRPDSLVVVVVLSDENDSEVDVRSFGGTAWNFMTQPGFNPPRGTSICATNPGDPGCTSCAFGKNGSDTQCETQNGTYTDPHDWGYDLNLRHAHEKQKYGVDVQFPIQRYVLGLTSTRVPNRDGEYPQGATSYEGLSPGNLVCINPLFAAKLPTSSDANWNPTSDELCNLTPGPRKPGSIFYIHIGGVPHQLLQQDPTNPDSPQKASLTAADWQAILGADPLNFDYTGIDPHMVESFKPRTSIPVPSNAFPVASPTSLEGTDPISSREWTTDSTMAEHNGVLVDLEYACTFKLAAPRDCSDAATQADQALQDSCDCEPPNPNTGSFTPDEIPGVCNGTTPTQQDSAKAYPTVREIVLAKLLGQAAGANEGLVSSICPIHTVERGAGDPLYGYRPAMTALVNSLKGP